MSVERYAYLNARVSLLAGRLLDPGEIQALIDGHGGAGRIRDDSGQNAGETRLADDLDQRNVTLLLQELTVLIRPLSGPPRDLLSYWAHRFELGNLKAIIRGKMTGQSQEVIQRQLLDMGGFAWLPTAELLQSDNIEELLRRLDRTVYASITGQARQLLERGEALFALDAEVDRRYFAGLARRGNEIGDAAGQLLRAMVGSIIDRINLVWLMRYRFAYDLPAAQAYYLLIPAGQRLSAQRLQQLAQAASFEEAMAGLPPPYDRLLAGVCNTMEVTVRLEFETWRIAGNVLRHSAFNVARALAYMVLRERDLRRQRAIIRGRSLPVTPDVIRAALGLARSEGVPSSPAG